MGIITELEKEMEEENPKDELIAELVNVCYDALRLRGLYEGIIDPTTFRAEAKEYVRKSKEIENNIRKAIQKTQMSDAKIDAIQIAFITDDHWTVLACELLERVGDGMTADERRGALAFINLAGQQVEQTQNAMMNDNALPPEKQFKAMLAEEAELLNKTWVGLTD